MPIYEFVCKCGNKTEEFVHKIRPNLRVNCNKCGQWMHKIISRVNTDMKHNFRWSRSMGVNIRQIDEAERLYPGSHYDRKTGYLGVENRKDKLVKMKERGLEEFE